MFYLDILVVLMQILIVLFFAAGRPEHFAAGALLEMGPLKNTKMHKILIKREIARLG